MAPKKKNGGGGGGIKHYNLLLKVKSWRGVPLFTTCYFE